MTICVTQAQDFDAVLLAGVPFIDVRAPVEFEHGTIPGAVNLPILETSEREQVGICYKQQGQQAAIELGHRLVGGDVRAQRTQRWCEFLDHNPQAQVFCWRGGMRSQLAAEWIADSGRTVRLVKGGYKALRNHLLAELAGPQPREPLYVIGGRTGSDKTGLVNSLPGGLDLEGFAHHRGSSFGRRVEQPPSQIDFENTLALALLRQRRTAPGTTLFLEDESRRIGAVAIPSELYQAMKAAPLVIVEMDLEFRGEQILRDYICADQAEYRRSDPEQGDIRFGESLLASLQRIARRLGDQRYRAAQTLMQEALDSQQRTGDSEGHRAWIELLLREYYDPMYEFQLQKAAERVVFRGDRDAVRQWCLSKAQSVLA